MTPAEALARVALLDHGWGVLDGPISEASLLAIARHPEVVDLALLDHLVERLEVRDAKLHEAWELLEAAVPLLQRPAFAAANTARQAAAERWIRRVRELTEARLSAPQIAIRITDERKKPTSEGTVRRWRRLGRKKPLTGRETSG